MPRKVGLAEKWTSPQPDLPGSPGALVRQVPAGRVTTYGALAQSLGEVIVVQQDVAHDQRGGDHVAQGSSQRSVGRDAAGRHLPD